MNDLTILAMVARKTTNSTPVDNKLQPLLLLGRIWKRAQGGNDAISHDEREPVKLVLL
jgi:hypothetical protein